MIDVERLRAETPGTAHVAHLNNAGASLMPTPVIDAVREYLDHEVRYGGYETEAALAPRIEDAYTAIASLIGAGPEQISMADNATRAWDVAFYGLDLGRGDRILTSSTEYSSNLAAFFHLRDGRGVSVDVIPDTEAGAIDPEGLEAMIDDRVKLIAVNHVPTSSGTVEPVEAVGAVARRHDIPFLLDACQSVGQLPIDVDAIGCDMLSATSRKFLRGPRGVGFLWVRETMVDHVHPPFVELESGTVGPDGFELHRDRRRFETWEKNYAGIVGLGVAVRYALDIGIVAISERVRALAADLRSELGAIDGVTVRDRGPMLGAIVTFDVAGWPAAAIAQECWQQSINVSVAGRHASPIDGHRRELGPMVRASVHAFNTHDELGRLVDLVAAGP